MSCIRSKHAMKVQPGRFEKIRKLLRRLQWHCRPLRSLVYSHVCMSGAVSCRTLHIVVISLQAAAALQLDSNILYPHPPFHAADRRIAAETVGAENHVLECIHP